MNRNLVVFSLLLILVGLAFGLYVISFFGLLILIPAFASSPRPPPRPASTQPRQQPRRIIPPSQPAPQPQPEQAAPPVQPKQMVSASPATQPQSYAPALFPSSMFPALSGMGSTLPAAKEAPAPKSEGRDELVEVGTMLALLKLVFG